MAPGGQIRRFIREHPKESLFGMIAAGAIVATLLMNRSGDPRLEHRLDVVHALAHLGLEIALGDLPVDVKGGHTANEDQIAYFDGFRTWRLPACEYLVTRKNFPGHNFFLLQIDLPRFYLQSSLITTYVFVPEFTRGRPHKMDLSLLATPIGVVSLAHPSTWIVGREKENN